MAILEIDNNDKCIDYYTKNKKSNYTKKEKEK